MLNNQQLQLVQIWNETKEQLKHLTQRESELREQVINTLFTQSKTEGTETLDLAGDWRLKATKSYNYTLTNKDNALVNICASMPEVIAQNLIRWKPELNLTVYRKVDAATQEQLAPVLTIKPSKPQLELVPPNASSVHE